MKKLMMMITMVITTCATNINVTNGQTAVKTMHYAPAFTVTIVPDTTNDKFILQVDNPSREKLQVTLEGEGVYYQYYTSDSQSRKRMDMSGAMDGQYTITVTCGKQQVKKQLTLNTTTDVVRKIVY